MFVFAFTFSYIQACHTTLLAQPYCSAYRECSEKLGGVLTSPTGTGTGSSSEQSWLGNCSAQCGGDKVYIMFLGSSSIFEVFFRTDCFPSKVDEGGCAESRVSYCRLPSPHTTCRLTQVVLGYLSSLDNFRQLSKNANH